MTITASTRAQRKTQAIFAKAFGKRAALLFKGASTARMIDTIQAAFARRMHREKASSVGFHIGDWAGDAAIVLALHMFPERFTGEEIRDVVDFVAAGLPYHCAALGTHFGYEDLARAGIREAKADFKPSKQARGRRKRTKR
jgi:hypothetical protein